MCRRQCAFVFGEKKHVVRTCACLALHRKVVCSGSLSEMMADPLYMAQDNSLGSTKSVVDNNTLFCVHCLYVQEKDLVRGKQNHYCANCKDDNKPVIDTCRAWVRLSCSRPALLRAGRLDPAPTPLEACGCTWASSKNLLAARNELVRLTSFVRASDVIPWSSARSPFDKPNMFGAAGQGPGMRLGGFGWDSVRFGEQHAATRLRANYQLCTQQQSPTAAQVCTKSEVTNYPASKLTPYHM